MPTRNLTNGEVREALQGSIAKWEAIIVGEGTDSGADNCPLCQTFYYARSCDGCPVQLKTGHRLCVGTPYEGWLKAHENTITHGQAGRSACTPEQLRMAEDEAAFLTGLDDLFFERGVDTLQEIRNDRASDPA